jgi:hypothetical protein
MLRKIVSNLLRLPFTSFLLNNDMKRDNGTCMVGKDMFSPAKMIDSSKLTKLLQHNNEKLNKTITS